MNKLQINNCASLPKFCKDCKFFKKEGIINPYSFAKCTKLYSIDLIDGKRIYDYASIVREYHCKEKYFEQKEYTKFETFINSIIKKYNFL